MGFLPWEIQVAFPRESQLRQSRYPTYHACWVFKCFHNPPVSDMDYRTSSMHIDVNACDCTRGVRTHVRECALKFYSGRKIPCHIGESNVHQRRDGLML